MSFDDQFSKSPDEKEYLSPHRMVIPNNKSRKKYYIYSNNHGKIPMWRSRKVEKSSQKIQNEAYVRPHKMANLKENSGSMRSPDKNMSPESTINVRIINNGGDNTFSYGSGGEPKVKFGEHFTGYFKDSSECSNQTDVSYGRIPTR